MSPIVASKFDVLPERLGACGGARATNAPVINSHVLDGSRKKFN